MTWGEFCSAAGVQSELSPNVAAIKFAVSKKWMATDSFSYFSKLISFVDSGFKVEVSSFSDTEMRYATMFYYDLFDTAGAFDSIQDMFDSLAQDNLFISEVKEVLYILRERCSSPEKTDNSIYSGWNPLKLHGVYTKAQIQSAFGLSTFYKKSSAREGVERIWGINLEAMFVDVIKKREEGSTTDYKDFAMGKKRFHWETQSTVSSTSPTAENCRNRTNHQLLFVRQQSTHPETKATMGYVYLGEVELVSMEGPRPIQIVWELKSPMSESAYAFASQYKAIG